MIIKTIFLAGGMSAAALLGYGALRVAAPDAAATVESFVRDRALGWNDEACAANPVGCLSSRYDKLAVLEGEVDRSIRSVRAEHGKVAALVEEQALIAGKNGAFLDQGRAVYRAAEVNPGQPISFAGRVYPSLDMLRAQLELLFQEKAALEQNLVSARALETKLKERLDGLMIQSGQISLAKRMVPAQLQLVKANKTLANFGENVAMIDGVISGSEAGISETDQLVRTTRDLMTPAKPGIPSNGATSKTDFDAYLRQ